MFREVRSYLDACGSLIDSTDGILNIDSAVRRTGSAPAGILCLTPLTHTWVANVCTDDEPITGEIVSYLAFLSKLGPRVAGAPLDGQVSYSLATGGYCHLRNAANEKGSEPIFRELRRVVQGGNPRFGKRVRYAGPSWEKQVSPTCASTASSDDCRLVSDLPARLPAVAGEVRDPSGPTNMSAIDFDPVKPDALIVRGYDGKSPAEAIASYKLSGSRSLHAVFRTAPKTCLAALILEKDENGLSQARRVADVVAPFAECGGPIIKVAR